MLAKPDSTFPIIIKPFKLNMAQTSDTLPTEVRFSIVNVSSQTFAPIVVSSQDALFKVTMPKSIAPGEAAEGYIRMKEDSPYISFDKSITIQLDDAKHSRFTIPVKRSLLPVIIPTGSGRGGKH